MTRLRSAPNVILRRLSRSDLIAFQAYRNDPEVARYQSWGAMDEDEARAFLVEMETHPLFTPGEWCQIAVADPQEGLIGDIGLFLSTDQSEAEVGITLDAQAQGKGYATTALRLAFNLIWEESPARSIRAWADQRNTASVALLRRVGMEHLGTETSDVVEEAFILRQPSGI